MTDVEPVMISCAQRAHTERVITLRELERVGIKPTVFESPCNPAGGPQNRHVAWRAVHHAATKRKPALFLEDDIVVNDLLFPRMLHMVHRNRRLPTSFTVFRHTLHPSECNDDWHPRLVQLINTKEVRGFYGTQCFYLPLWLVDEIVDSKYDFMTEDESFLEESEGFDFWIKENVDEIYMAFPNPVDHRQPPKMKNITRGQVGFQVGHRSLSYHLGFRPEVLGPKELKHD